MTSSHTVERTIISTVPGGVRDRREHGDRRVGVDAGPPDEVAVGAALVPGDRLADESVDDVAGQRRADAELGDAGEHAAHDDAAGADDADDAEEDNPGDQRRRGHLALLEAGQDDVVGHPLHGDARQHGARWRRWRPRHGDDERPRVQADHRQDHPPGLRRNRPSRRAIRRRFHLSLSTEAHRSGRARATYRTVRPSKRQPISPLPSRAGERIDQLNVALLVVRLCVRGRASPPTATTRCSAAADWRVRLAGSASIGMRWPALQARLAAATEITTGLLFAAGLLTPLAAAGMIGVMTVAFWAAHRHNGFFITQGAVGVRRRHRRRGVGGGDDRAGTLQPRSRLRHRLDGLVRGAHRRAARGGVGCGPAGRLLPPCASRRRLDGVRPPHGRRCIPRPRRSLGAAPRQVPRSSHRHASVCSARIGAGPRP